MRAIQSIVTVSLKHVLMVIKLKMMHQFIDYDIDITVGFANFVIPDSSANACDQLILTPGLSANLPVSIENSRF